MNKRNLRITLGVLALLVIFCSLGSGGVVYWALNKPEISTPLKQFNASLSQMMDLQQEISAVYPAQAVKVGLMNGHILTITMINSDAHTLPLHQQAARAKEVAKFAKKHYARASEIDSFLVTQVKQDRVFVFTMNTTKNFEFNTSELP